MPNVFAEMQEVSQEFIDTLTNAESQQANALTIYMTLMQTTLEAYQGKIQHDASKADDAAFHDGGDPSKVQYFTSKMSMYSNQADNMKTIFSSNQQSLTQVVSSEGTAMTNYVQQAENGMEALQTANSLTQSPYP